MIETGIVESGGPIATIRFKRTSACSKCGRCRTMAEPGEGYMLITAANRAGAVAGDTVTVSIPQRDVLWAAVYAYLIPWAAGVTGMLTGAAVAPRFAVAAEIGGMVLGIVALGGAYALLAALDRGARATGRFRPVVSAVVGTARPAEDN